jgi:hypothetical protein
MNRFVAMVLLTAAGTVIFVGSAQAGSFYDGCAADWADSAATLNQSRVDVGPGTANIGRNGCPWYIAEVFGSVGKKLDFGPKWAYFQPSTAAACNGAKMSYFVARKDASTLYTVVGSGTVTGTWATWFGASFCIWNTTAGTPVTTVTNAPNDTYRVFLRAWEASGTERSNSGTIGVNVYFE